ncbi:MAG: serine hydrolase domain-containing protein [Myxococcota bacterium]
MSYSGGGIQVSQLVVEDVTGLTYEQAARRYVFDPLGMARSTFASPLPQNTPDVACAHDAKGRPRALPRCFESMPESAASGLWTSARELAHFLAALLGDDEFLPLELRRQMFTRSPGSWHGLGPRVNGSGETLVFHHGGANDSYQAWIEGHPGTGDGIVVLTNSAGGRALAYELRLAVQRQEGWKVLFPRHFETPKL